MDCFVDLKRRRELQLNFRSTKQGYLNSNTANRF